MIKQDRLKEDDEILFNGYMTVVQREPQPGVLRQILLTNDAAAVMPLEEKDGKTYVWLNNEYRAATDSYSLQLPAGTHEPDKTEKEMILDELVQEQGKKYQENQLEFHGTYHSSIGLMTEEVGLYTARGPYKPVPQELEHGELVEPVAVELNDAYNMVLRGEITCPRAKMLIPMEVAKRQQEEITALEIKVKQYEQTIKETYQV